MGGNNFCAPIRGPTAGGYCAGARRSRMCARLTGYAWIPVLSGREADWDVLVEGQSLKDGDDRQIFVNCMSPAYWQTMGLALLAAYSPRLCSVLGCFPIPIRRACPRNNPDLI